MLSQRMKSWSNAHSHAPWYLLGWLQGFMALLVRCSLKLMSSFRSVDGFGYVCKHLECWWTSNMSVTDRWGYNLTFVKTWEKFNEKLLGCDGFGRIFFCWLICWLRLVEWLAFQWGCVTQMVISNGSEDVESIWSAKTEDIEVSSLCTDLRVASGLADAYSTLWSMAKDWIRRPSSAITTTVSCCVSSQSPCPTLVTSELGGVSGSFWGTASRWSTSPHVQVHMANPRWTLVPGGCLRRKGKLRGHGSWRCMAWPATTITVVPQLLENIDI